MKVRNAGAVAAVIAALSLPLPALGAYEPAGIAPPPQRLLATQSSLALGAPTDLSLEFLQAEGRAAPHDVTILLPAGYALDLGRPAGTAVGEASLVIDIAFLGVSNMALGGGVSLVDPAALDAGAATACTGAPAHTAALRVDLDLSAGLPFWPDVFPVVGYLDPAAPENSARGYAWELRFCLPPVAAMGLDRFSAVLRGLVANPAAPGPRVLSLLFTPWAGDGFSPNPAGTAEIRAVGGLTPALSLNRVGRARVHRGDLLRLRGALLPDAPAPGRSVTIWSGASAGALAPVGTARTDALGSFRFSLRAKRKGAVLFLATYEPAGFVDVTATGCAAPSPAAPAGCVSASLGPAVSRLVRFVVGG